MRTDRGHVQSVQRASSLLEIIASTEHEWAVTEVSRAAKLPVSTVHRLLTTLCGVGFVIQNPSTGQYRIGARAFEVGNAFPQQTHLRNIAETEMQQLARRTNGSVNLVVPDGIFGIYVSQVESAQVAKLPAQSGSRMPLYCTAAGKVLLARIPGGAFDASVASIEMVPRTSHTITSVAVLRQSIELVRCKGYAFDDQEFAIGVRCISAPIYNHQNEIIAAVSISSPYPSMEDSRLPTLLDHLHQTTDLVSRQLGFTRNSYR